ncbi:DNA-directed primase/polymerase protein-like [Physella acuta]|uniref:DNA-directed primase/polymerase protein-like n=1 Tax=Physella acuta TaxID=109671 RepID=UPI0027DC227C|nr:DNA-directed primase/polymerase protein-like [Physella acuta]
MTSEAHFSVIKFYGTPKPRRKRKKFDPDLEKIQPMIPKAFPHRILGPTESWRVFYRQADAFKFAAKSEDTLVFAVEKSAALVGVSSGKRQYLVTSLPVFWHFYSQLEAGKRHHYEIIPKECLCKLYFDLEFLKDFNLEHNGDNMTDILIQYVCLWLKIIYQLDCNRTNVLDLDASTGSKFSRHLIFQLPGALFENCVVAGYFVHYIFHQLINYLNWKSPNSQEHALREVILTSQADYNKSALAIKDEKSSCTNGDDKSLACANEDDKSACANEDGFEIEDEDKMSLVAEHCELKCLGQTGVDVISANVSDNMHGVQLGSKRTRNDSICDVDHSNLNVRPTNADRSNLNVRPANVDKSTIDVCGHFTLEQLTSLVVINKDRNKTLVCDLGVYTKNRNFRLYLSSKQNKHNPLDVSRHNLYYPDVSGTSDMSEAVFYSSLISQRCAASNVRTLSFAKTASSPTLIEHGVHHSHSDHTQDSMHGYSATSPYPEIDGFIQGLIRVNGNKGTIRQWIYFSDSQTLLYEVAGYRWCGNIQRQHRSNNIMYVVDIQHGIYYQKCHDPECQGYRSESKDVPYHLLPASFFIDQDDVIDGFQTDSDDDMLSAAMEEVDASL